MIERRCGCCHRQDLLPLLRAPDRDARSVVIFHCASCCALTPGYDVAEGSLLGRQIKFHEDFWCAETEQKYITDRDAMCGVLDFHSYHLRRDRPHLIYDLGAGRANLLACLLMNGYQAVGCEPSAQLVERARSVYGLDEQTLAELDIQSFLTSRKADIGKVSVIFLWHVIEHVSDPVSILKLCANYLSVDGVILGQGPLLHSEYVFPEHNFLHSESNLTWLADAAGLKILYRESENPSRYISFILAREDHPHQALPRLFENDLLDAAGALYITQSLALQHLTRL